MRQVKYCKIHGPYIEKQIGGMTVNDYISKVPRQESNDKKSVREKDLSEIFTTNRYE